MKTVYVVRHSKAEQNFIGSDFERKLTEKGIANSN
jgi:phosphohistidine phosphatase SixA